MNIQAKVLSKKIYMDYEVYTFEIQNNSKDGIILIWMKIMQEEMIQKTKQYQK